MTDIMGKLSSKRHGELTKEGTAKWRRSYKACLNCRTKKVKCDMGPVGNPHGPPCLRCRRERKKCEFPPSKHRVDIGQEVSDMCGIPTASAVKKCGYESSTHSKEVSDSGTSALDSKWKIEVYSMQNALEFLAKAAGSVAHSEGPDINSELNSSSMQNALSKIVKSFSIDQESSAPPECAHNTQSSARAAPFSFEGLGNMQPQLFTKLTDIEFIGDDRVISEMEAIKLIDAFFLRMHPFFPHIPLQLQEPEELVRYPLLLCAILTVSSRYQSFRELKLFEGSSGDRALDIHEKLWAYSQRLISQTIWAEASTRSIGTVLAFLLFTEWNPRAIHSKWQDYANDSESSDSSRRDTRDIGTIKETKGLIGLESIRRSDRMAWMLTGSAVRLAQDMGFIETNCKIFIATHIAETQTAMQVNQRSILAESLNDIKFEENDEAEDIQSLYFNHILENDKSRKRWLKFVQEMRLYEIPEGSRIWKEVETEFLNDEYILFHAASNVNENLYFKGQKTTPLPSQLKFTKSQKAKIELLKIISIGNETIYCDKGNLQLFIKDPRANLVILKILSPLIENWYKNYNDLLSPATNNPNYHALMVDGESLICDYSYCQLYIYSLALQVDVRENPFKLKEIAKSAKYVEIAYSAAKEILVSAERLRSFGLARFLPVRWVARIVRAIAFIIKCYLTLTGNKTNTIGNPVANTILRLTVIPIEETLPLVETAAEILNETSPDELHLGKRYSTIISYLCSEMRTNNFKNKNREQEYRAENETSNLPPRRTEQHEQTDTIAESRDTNHLPQHTTAPDMSQHDAPLQPMNSLPNEIMDWFFTSEDIGLDFVDPWTEMIEQKYMEKSHFHQQDSPAAG